MATEAEVLNRLEAEAATPAPPSQPVQPTVPPKEPPVAEPGQPPAQEPPAEKPPEGVPPVEPEEEEPLDIDQPAEASGNFEEFKPVFDSHPELKSKLKQIIGREAAYSELGQFSEVKQIVERVPTLEDAETLVQQAENTRTLSETLRNDPVAFVESLKEIDPLAFHQLAERLPEVLRSEEPDVWRTYAMSFSSEVLENAYGMAQRSNDNELMQAIATVHRALGLSSAPQRSARAAESPEIVKLRKEKAEREQADTQAQFDTFWNGTDAAIIEQSVGSIEEALKKALPNATPNQLERMKKEAWEQTLAILIAQPQTAAQIETFRKNALKGRMSNAEYRQIVAFGTGRARLVIPKTVRSVVNEWTKEVLRVNTETTTKKKAIAANTRDAGTGPQGTTSAAQPPSANGKRRTTDDIFRELENRTYVAPSRRT